MESAGSALMGIGSASGENRAIEAAKMAINSPLLDVSITGAKGVLFSIAGGEDLTMFEIQDAAKVITESVDPNAKVIFGTVRDDKLKKNEVKITVIAAGFPEGALPTPVQNKNDQGNQLKSSVFPSSETKPKEESRGKIFNSISSQPVVKEKVEEKKDLKNEVQDDDDWGAVPAFLRRSKLK